MTISITGRNPNDVFPKTIQLIREKGVILPSRNGPMKEVPEPVSVTFTHPKERVLFHVRRRINPFLHFFEPFWILAGRNDLAFLKNIVSRFEQFSDDGKTLYGAYGYRLAHPFDQILWAINRLKEDPHDRRVVLQIRRPDDIQYKGKDTPCNTSVALKIRDGKLNMHVFNRSNDAIWGGPAGGSNHPQFTILQEYIAGCIGCAVGIYTVTTDSLHAYIENPQWKIVENSHEESNYYVTGAVKTMDIMGEVGKFNLDLQVFFDDSTPDKSFKSIFFKVVFAPMWASLCAYKQKEYDNAILSAEDVAAEDWKEVTVAWLKGFLEERQDIHE